MWSVGRLGNASMGTETNRGQYNKLIFPRVPLGRRSDKVDEILTVKGLRVNANILGWSTNRDVKRILGSVEVVPSDARPDQPAIAR